MTVLFKTTVPTASLAEFKSKPRTPPGIDENLLLEASSRGEDCRLKMRELLSQIPTARTAITELIKEKLSLDGEKVSVLFHATDHRSSRICSLSDICALLIQHPGLRVSQLPTFEITQLPATSPFHSRPAAALFDALKALAIKPFLVTRWNTYWNSRAKNTRLSRRNLATQLYKTHVEVATQLALAHNTLNAEQLKPLWSIIDPDHDRVEVDRQRVYAESLCLILPDGPKRRLPGAWVFTLDSDQPVTQLLYLPTREPALRSFAHRNELEQWVIDHKYVLFGVTAIVGASNLHYELETTPLDLGMSQVLEQISTAQLDSLVTSSPHSLTAIALNPVDESDGRYGTLDHAITEDVSHVMGQAAALDTRYREHPFFAALPALPMFTADETALKITAQLGTLYDHLPLSTRQAMIRLQREAIQALLGASYQGDFNDSNLQALKAQLDTLASAQNAASTAASAILDRTGFNVIDHNAQNQALYQARLKGLRAEANIQRILNQISAPELLLLESVLDHPNPDERIHKVDIATLKLSINQQDGDTRRITFHTLSGPLVIAPPGALLSGATPQGMLLYWPGRGGGLQHFNSRQELEQALFMIQANDKVLALHFDILSTDPFWHSLRSQQQAFEEQADAIRLRHPSPLQNEQQTTLLNELREQAIDTFWVPIHEARDEAFLQIIEQSNSSHLAGKVPEWLSRQPEATRSRFKALLTAFVPALRDAEEIIDCALPPRDDYVKQQIDTQLRKDFLLKHPFTIEIDLPDHVESRRETIPGSAPGTPTRIKKHPSATRTTLSLYELAMINIDSPTHVEIGPINIDFDSDMGERMGFMNTAITSPDNVELVRLKAGITADYLKKIVSRLDLPQRYENLIRETFQGTPSQSTFEREHRVERLLEPLRLELLLHGECAHQQQHINSDELQILQTAIGANTPDAWNSNNRRIRLLPAILTASGADTRYFSSTLSAVTFIEEQNSGTTLLYLPDAPDNRTLRRYDSLEHAREDLYRRCAQDQMVSYLAGRAIEGNVRAHSHRIRQAVEKHHSAIIGTGQPWPASTSLAAHLLNAHMGRLILAHRNTSRSNVDLKLEHYSLKHGTLFNGIKAVLGFIPFVGTAVSAWDTGTSLIGSVEAFRRGEHSNAMANLESAVESLVYAALDLVTIAALPSARPGIALKLTRLRHGTALPRPRALKPLMAIKDIQRQHARFLGYHYDKTISLEGIEPEPIGKYRNIYRHPEGDFIVHQRHVFQVEYDNAKLTWRLKGTRDKTYQQPIALDAIGEWNTHGALYGTLVEGGLAGGMRRGRTPKRIVPPVVEQQVLPPAQDVLSGRQEHIREIIDLTARFEQQVSLTDNQITHYNTNLANLPRSTAAYQSAIRDIDAPLAREFNTAKQNYQRFSQPDIPLAPADLRLIKNNSAYHAANRTQLRTFFSRQRLSQLYAEMTALRNQQHNASDYTQSLMLTNQIKTLNIKILDELTLIRTAQRELADWVPLITDPRGQAHITSTVNELKENFPLLLQVTMKANQHLQLIHLAGGPDDIGWYFHRVRMKASLENLENALQSHLSLRKTRLGRARTNQILQYNIELYEQFQRDLLAWHTGSPNYFEGDYVTRLLDDLKQLTTHARKAIKPAPSEPVHARAVHTYENESGQPISGVEIPQPEGSPRQFLHLDATGRTETWTQISQSNRYTRIREPNPAPLSQPTDTHLLLSEARTRLNAVEALETKVNSYRTMEPINLEHMLVSEADGLELRANQLEKLNANDALVQQLRDTATGLKSRGRVLRTERTLGSQQPTEGYLDYLSEQGKVEIKQVGSREHKASRLDGEPDYLQEYVINDLTQSPAVPLWYAHFHYTSNTQPFEQFVKAHLKLPKHRHKGLKWQQSAVDGGAVWDNIKIWRGNVSRQMALKHFQHLN